jgi:phosphatidylglycerol---prolipoprotein diacylglyceryl transferase
MRRVLFHVGGRQIWSYPALLYVGLVSGFYVMYAIAPRLGMPATAAALAVLVMFVPALAGSRLWFVLDHWAIYRHDPRRIWRLSEGGMTLYGGLVLALLLSPALLSAFGLGFWQFWDGATFTMLVGMLVTRVGCLLNGCCAGRCSEAWFALRLPDHRGEWERRYPVQLLEIAAATTLLVVSAMLLSVHLPSGTVFGVALFGYASARLLIDPLRQRPPAPGAGRRTALTVFVACSVLASVAGWAVTVW